jgi:hypothetical protein
MCRQIGSEFISEVARSGRLLEASGFGGLAHAETKMASIMRVALTTFLGQVGGEVVDLSGAIEKMMQKPSEATGLAAAGIEQCAEFLALECEVRLGAVFVLRVGMHEWRV